MPNSSSDSDAGCMVQSTIISLTSHLSVDCDLASSCNVVQFGELLATSELTEQEGDESTAASIIAAVACMAERAVGAEYHHTS